MENQPLTIERFVYYITTNKTTPEWLKADFGSNKLSNPLYKLAYYLYAANAINEHHNYNLSAKSLLKQILFCYEWRNRDVLRKYYQHNEYPVKIDYEISLYSNKYEYATEMELENINNINDEWQWRDVDNDSNQFNRDVEDEIKEGNHCDFSVEQDGDIEIDSYLIPKYIIMPEDDLLVEGINKQYREEDADYDEINEKTSPYNLCKHLQKVITEKIIEDFKDHQEFIDWIETKEFFSLKNMQYIKKGENDEQKDKK